jgi:dsDNA-specific endonuclease/ATPase MutS2
MQHGLILELKRERAQHASNPICARAAQAHIAEQVTKLMEDHKQSRRRKAAALRGDSSATLRQQGELDNVQKLIEADRAEMPTTEPAPALEQSQTPNKARRAKRGKKTSLIRIANELNSLEKEPYRLPPLLPSVQPKTHMADLFMAGPWRSV